MGSKNMATLFLPDMLPLRLKRWLRAMTWRVMSWTCKEKKESPLIVMLWGLEVWRVFFDLPRCIKVDLADTSAAQVQFPYHSRVPNLQMFFSPGKDCVHTVGKQ